MLSMIKMMTMIKPDSFQHVMTVWGWFFSRTIKGNLRKSRREVSVNRYSCAKIFLINQVRKLTTLGESEKLEALIDASAPDPWMGDAKFVCKRQGKERVQKNLARVFDNRKV